MPCANEAEGHCRAEIGTRAGIAAGEYARHVGPGRIKTGDDAAVAVQHLGAAVGAQPGESPEVTGRILTP